MIHLLLLILACAVQINFARTRNRFKKDLLVDGELLFQGDMVMEEDMVSQIMESDIVPPREKFKINRLWNARNDKKGARRRPRAAVKSRYRIWGEEGVLQTMEMDNGETLSSYGIIPYTFAPKTASWKKKLIESAIEHWETNTRYNDTEEYCIKFVPRTNEENYVSFVYANGRGCWSKVGKSTSIGSQKISLGPRCGEMGLIAHEIGHALGFFHEQSRPDRDSWIKIVNDNVIPDKTHNFIKYTDYLIDPKDVAYDYSSIMHYRLNAFSKNGQDTIEPLRDQARGVQIGQREHVSVRDVEQIRRMYGCPAPITATSSPAVDEEKSTTSSELDNLIPEPTEPKGSWSWDFRRGQWVWNSD